MVHYVAFVQSRMCKNEEDSKGTVYEIRVEFDVIVLSWAALYRCVRFRAYSRAEDRCNGGTSRESLRKRALSDPRSAYTLGVQTHFASH